MIKEIKKSNRPGKFNPKGKYISLSTSYKKGENTINIHNRHIDRDKIPENMKYAVKNGNWITFFQFKEDAEKAANNIYGNNIMQLCL